MLDVARNALRHLTDRRRVTLVVNPDDLELVGDCVNQLQSELGGIEHLGVQSDRRVARGGAIAHTDAGDIDAGLDDPARARHARSWPPRSSVERQPMTTDAPAASRPGGRLARAIQAVQEADLSRRVGRVSDLIGLIIEATGVQVEIGEVCMVGDGRDRAAGGLRGGRLPRRPHAVDAARRAARHRPRHQRASRPARRSAWRSASRCSAA